MALANEQSLLSTITVVEPSKGFGAPHQPAVFLDIYTRGAYARRTRNER